MNPVVTSFGKRRASEAPVPAAISTVFDSPPEPPAPATVGLTHPSAHATAAGDTLAAKRELRALCLARIDPTSAAALPQDTLMPEVERLVAEIADERRIGLSGREQREVATELVDDMLGLGPLAPLLEDDSVTDIMVNGPYRVFVERRGKVALSTARFRDNGHLAGIAQRIASAVGRRIDGSSPMVDARLADGSRVNIVFPPPALQGPCLSIRKFAKRKLDFAQMVRNGSVSPAMAKVLEIAARARLNVVVSGGMGSGKTTMPNALSRLIDPSERIVTVEDAAELQLQQPHVVSLETRPPNLEGRGEVTQRDLVKNALRMRPDRIILGECRGAEAFDMLQAMNTGHDGSMSTIHANNTRDAVTRIENMVLMGQTSLPARDPAPDRRHRGPHRPGGAHARRRAARDAGDGGRRAGGRGRGPARRLPVDIRRRGHGRQAPRHIPDERRAPGLPAAPRLFRPGPRLDLGARGTDPMSPGAALALLPLALGLAVAAALALRGGSGGARGRRLSARLAGAAQGRAMPGRQGAARPVLRRLRQPRAARPVLSLDWHVAALFGWMPERLHQYPAPPAVLVALMALLALPAGAYPASAFGPWGWVAAPVLWIGAARGLFGMIHSRRAEAMYRQLPDALATVVRSVRAGIPVSQALRTVGTEMPDPTGAEFRGLADQLAIGIGIDQALLGLARRSGLPEYGFFRVALTLQGSAGGNLTETLENLADTVRKRVAICARGVALASQARASAYIQAMVPVITGLALLVIDPGYVALLVEGPRGQTILAIAVILLLTGLGTMKLIIRRSLA
jgi:pilus assembly protein CpaF